MIIKPFVEKNYKNENALKGQKNEKQGAYYIDFEYAKSERTMVLHDLRLEFNGRVAQIDHLLINNSWIFVIENKFFSGTLSCDENENWTVQYDNNKLSIPSPIQQNERHISVLKEILKSEDLFKSIPKIFNIVIISDKTILEGFIPKEVVKADMIDRKRLELLETHLKNPLKLMSAATKLFVNNDIKNIAEKIMSFHIESIFDKTINKKDKVEYSLFEELRKLRYSISKQEKIKPYMVFNDKTLLQLSKSKPKTKEEMLKINGIAEIKYEKYGGKFLQVILNNNV